MSWTNPNTNSGKLIQPPRKSAIIAATRRPCSRPASADGTRHAGSSGFGPNAATEDSSAKTLNADPWKSAISAAASPANGDGVSSPRAPAPPPITVLNEREVDGAAHPAVHVAPASYRHRRPDARDGATGGHRVDQLDTDARSNATSSPVAVSIAVIHHGPASRATAGGGRSPRAGRPRQRSRSIAPPHRCVAASRRSSCSAHHRGDEQLDDGVDGYARIEFKRLLGHLTGKQLVETDTAAELSGHRGTG